MNIYDFDGTIYEGDSCRDIVKYGLKYHFFITLRSLIKASKLNKEYKKGNISFDKVKEALLSFLFEMKDRQAFIDKFVNTHLKNIKPFYKDIQTENDVIVTASYELWIGLFAEKLGIKHVIATKTDENGHIIGTNCKRKEKVRRVKEMFPNKTIENCYSDSSADIPVLELGKKAYVVEGNELILYKKGYNFKYNK